MFLCLPKKWTVAHDSHETSTDYSIRKIIYSKPISYCYIEDAMVRVESLLANAVEEANKNESTTAISIRTVQSSLDSITTFKESHCNFVMHHIRPLEANKAG